MKWCLLFTHADAEEHHNGIVFLQEMFVTKTKTQLTGSLGPSSHNTFSVSGKYCN